MSKIKNFFKKTFSPICNFFRFTTNKVKSFFEMIFGYIADFFRTVKRKIKNFFRRLGQTRFVQKAKYIIMYLPDKLFGRLKNSTRKSIWGVIFVIPLIIGFIYFFLLPFIYTIIFSLSYVENGGKWEFLGFDNYIYAFQNATAKDANYTVVAFGEWVVNSVISIITDIPIILIFSMIMAVVLNSKFRGRAAARAIFFIPVIFNSQAIDTAVSAYASLANTTAGATNDLFSKMFNFKDFLMEAKMPAMLVTFLGDASSKIYDIISYSGIQILIFLSAIQSVPRHLYEAAKMEGATQYEMFWKITFPMVSPMLLAAAVYTVVDSFLRSPILTVLKQFDSTGKVDDFTQDGKLGMLIYGADGTTDGIYRLTEYGIHSAMSVIFTVVVALIMVVILGILSKVVFYYDE